MRSDSFNLFHQGSKRFPPIPRDRARWPAGWTDIEFKEYLKTSKISLPTQSLNNEIGDLLSKRRSARNFSLDETISKKELSILLRYACGSSNLETSDKQSSPSTKRTYPSGGSRYPLEIYPVILRRGEGLNPGIFHYGIKNHELNVLKEVHLQKDDLQKFSSLDWLETASAVIVLTAVFKRTTIKYGSRGYRLILLEAGHIGQNVYLLAETLGLKCCSILSTKDEQIENLLGVDGTTESVVYAIAIGK